MAALKRLTNPSADTGEDKYFGTNINDWYDTFNGTNTNAVTIGGTLTAKGAFHINNPADTFYYDITPAAIAANRTLNLPLLTATDTLAVLDMAQAFTNKTMSGALNTFSNIGYASLVLTGSIVNADISGSAAIAYSKLNLTGSIVNADVSGSAAIAYSKLSLTNSIVDGDIVSITTRAKLPSAIAYEDEANTFSGTLTMSAANIALGANKFKTTGAELYSFNSDTSWLLRRTTANSPQRLYVMPNGTSKSTEFALFADDDVTLTAFRVLSMAMSNTDIIINSSQVSSSLLPIKFQMGGSDMITLNTALTMNFNSRAVSNLTMGSDITMAGNGITSTALIDFKGSSLAVNAVSPTSPNRTLSIKIGGVTYYIHAKTTND